MFKILIISCLTPPLSSLYFSYSWRIPQFGILRHPVHLLDSPRGIYIIIIQCGQVNRNVHILGWACGKVSVSLFVVSSVTICICCAYFYVAIYLNFLLKKRSSFRWFAELLAILAPFILVVFVSLLPYILLAFVKFEGLIEIETMQHPSLFTKLASFTIIQTFFITTIAGTLFASIQDIIQNPTQGLADIASALPEQSANFIQIIIIQNLPPLGIELLRISPIVQNILRGIVSNRLGHNLTEKERTVSCLFWSSKVLISCVTTLLTHAHAVISPFISQTVTVYVYGTSVVERSTRVLLWEGAG